MGFESGIKEKVRREAASHQDSCNCLTCRAASGDEDAMNSLMKELR